MRNVFSRRVIGGGGQGNAVWLKGWGIRRLWIRIHLLVVGVSLDESACCGGVLLDEKGVVSTLFSGNCEAGSLEMVVLMAIKVAVEMFLGLFNKVHHPLIIEFDLNTVSDWLKYKSIHPWSLRMLLAKIED